MEHVSECCDSQQDIHHAGETAAPCTEEGTHFVFVCAFSSSTVTLCTSPGHTAEDGTEDPGKDVEQVECTQVLNVIRVQHGFAGIAVQQSRNDLTHPVELVEDIDTDDGIERIRYKPLNAVCDHDGDLTALCDDPDSQTQEDEHEQTECGEVPATDIDVRRKVQEVHDAAGTHSREDRIVDDPGDRLQEGSINTERSVITHFKELPHSHSAGFAITVGTVPGQTQKESERCGNRAPETDCETAFVIHFPDSDEGDQPHPGFTGCHADHITACDTTGSQKVGYCFYILLCFQPNDKHNHQRDADDNPIQPIHCFFLIVCVVL